jgi:hypothetical protein
LDQAELLMLAYVFWHRPAEGVAPETYAESIEHFHRSLAARPPEGFVVSSSLRAPAPNWLGDQPAFEDWYVVEDFAALGVLNAAAVGRGHLSAHDAAARHSGVATAGIYSLLEGSVSLAAARVAVWIDRPRGVEAPLLAALLGDGMDGRHAGLWQRQLVLGPAPEYCVLAPEPPRGVAPTRLPAGWTATTTAREPL